MSITIVSSFIFAKKRKLVQIFPDSLRIAWNLWEIRATVLLSLILQAGLIRLGNRRKHSTSNWLRFVLWLAYLSADWLATLSLSILSSSSTQEDGNSKELDHIIKAFWAPFLLLHLGGPDTITASSLEDNELWWRHFLVLLVQVGVAIYIFFSSLGGHVLNLLAIPMFVAGIIKFGERTWVLRSASSDNFRESMFPPPDPGPNYARYMNEFRSKQVQGYKVELGSVIETPKVGYHSNTSQEGIFDGAANLQEAHVFFSIFKALFADLILSIHDIENSKSFFKSRSYGEAFEVIEIELGFMYDVFYTKAVLVYSVKGAILRFISFVCIIFVSVIFFVIEKQAYSEENIIITYILLAGAITLEIQAVVSLLCSDWTRLWLSKNKKAAKLLHPVILSISSAETKKKWSNSMKQYNLIRFCLEDEPVQCSFLHNVPMYKKGKIYKKFKKHLYMDLEKVCPELKEMIFQQLLEKSERAKTLEDYKRLCAHKGDWVLKNKNRINEFGWSIGEEIDKSILIWHIATDLCYYSDDMEDQNSVKHQNCINSKLLSEYMLYLLVMCPFMLPNGIGQIRFQDTCAEAMVFFKETKFKGAKEASKEAREELLDVSTDILPAKIKGDRSKSVLFDACRLAKDLQRLETEEEWDNQKKWKLISHVWVEMLSYAASQCPRSQHAQQLRHGGELLTHVWFLMAHLGITEQFQISQGQARAKWIVQ
ncbi:uncharacterized protein LOC110768875 [Prunus avium]|uniref:Uncharacterized protein LOC110768875 n=1 Tax=Prunus avium TaxID=42229 RepID=A0A6P5TN78_PRUAV|nr:uncharacterized protein LOC110768875 [Prunus avium]